MLAQAAPAALSAPLSVVHAEFGLFRVTPEAKSTANSTTRVDLSTLNFEQTTRIPRKTGQRYGWVIAISPPKPRLSVREEYLVPQKLAPDRKPIENEIILERRIQVSQRHLVPVNGRIYGEWEIGPDEPTGHRHLQVIIEDNTVVDFEFDVEPATP